MDRPKPLLIASSLALYAHFALQLIAGGLLATVYRADPANAHATAAHLHGGAWRFLQGFHYWGSAVIIVHATLHLAAVTWAGWYRTQVRAYLAAFSLAALAMAFQLTGNALPWDRHGVGTASVEGQIAAQLPVVGPRIARAALGGETVGPATLGLWWSLHSLFLSVAAALAILYGLSSRLQLKAPRWTLLLPALAALALAVLVAAPLGTAATPADYGKSGALPSWYTVPMHGFLVWGNRLVPGGGWIGAAVVPALFGAFLLLLPAFKKAKPAFARVALLGFGALGVAATVTSGGDFAALVGTRDPKVRKTLVAKGESRTQNKALKGKGKTVYDRTGCAGCHGANGLKGVGGPSLKDVWKEHPDAAFYVRYIHNPQSVDKGSTMPAYPSLQPEELRALAEFLRFPR